MATMPPKRPLSASDMSMMTMGLPGNMFPSIGPGAGTQANPTSLGHLGMTDAEHQAQFGPNGVPMGSSSSGATPTPSTPGAPVEFHADTNAALDALSKRYDSHLNDLENNSGKIMDMAGQRMRDAREGGRKSMSDTMTLSGKASDPASAQYEADTTRGVEGAIADTEAQREAQLTSALQGGVSVHSASPEFALKEKALQVQAYGQQAQVQAQDASANFDRFLALLNAQRQSPIYTGAEAAPAPEPGKPVVGGAKWSPTMGSPYGRG